MFAQIVDIAKGMGHTGRKYFGEEGVKMEEKRGKIQNKKMTINDVAEVLGVSVSTVSRAISGKGRIGEATRRRVLEFIEEHDYHPNGIAKSLAQSRTNNIAIIIPDVKGVVALPFFYLCMCGVNEVAQARGYDMFVVSTSGKDTSQLKRLIDNRKVDGMILGSTYKEDVFASFLKSKGIPFVAIGSLDDEEVVQIDHDNEGACRDLTSILLSRRWRRIAYMGNSKNLLVDEARYNGYIRAHRDIGVEIDKSLIFREEKTESAMRSHVDELLGKRVDCIICQDDAVCNIVLDELRAQGARIPVDMRVASCHNSKVLDNYPVSVTTLRFDNTEIGRVACATLLDMLEGKEVSRKTWLDYEVVLKESTK